jgi:hypothetical protein
MDDTKTHPSGERTERKESENAGWDRCRAWPCLNEARSGCRSLRTYPRSSPACLRVARVADSPTIINGLTPIHSAAAIYTPLAALLALRAPEHRAVPEPPGTGSLWSLISTTIDYLSPVSLQAIPLIRRCVIPKIHAEFCARTCMSVIIELFKASASGDATFCSVGTVSAFDHRLIIYDRRN